MISRDRARRLLRRLGGDAGRVAEVLSSVPSKQSKTTKCDLSGILLALAGAAAEHLLEEDAGLDRPQEDDELQVGDVDAGGEHIDGHDDAGVGPVAELADALQRPVDARR